MKALKIVGSILLVLVLVAGTYVGIITKGFRKWSNLKTEKQKVIDFYNYGKDGVSEKDYNTLLSDYKSLEEQNGKLSEQVILLNTENDLLNSKNSALQEKLNTQPEYKLEKTFDGYELDIVSLVSDTKTFYSFTNKVLSTQNIKEYTDYFTSSNIDFSSLDYFVRFNLLKLNETKNSYENISSVNYKDSSKAMSSMNGDYTLNPLVIEYDSSITEEQTAMIINNSGESFICNGTLSITLTENETYEVTYTLKVLSQNC